MGKRVSVEDVVSDLKTLRHILGIHNVHFVTPDPFVPHVIQIVHMLRAEGIRVPVVMNVSGYQSIETLKVLEPFTDIYLADFKYGDPHLAQRLSLAPGYTSVALDALSEMIRQKGYLKVKMPSQDAPSHPPLAVRGLLVRHLVLPGHIRNSLDALSMLFAEFGPKIPLSLMAQYTPVRPIRGMKELNRQVNPREFQQVLDHAMALGFERIYFQDPMEVEASRRPFLPDFTKPQPFPGNPKVNM